MQHVNELCTIRHRTASGRVDEWWEFLPAGGFPAKPNRILMSMRLGSAPAVECEVSVCSHRHPLPDSWIIVRKGEHHWMLTAAKMPLDMQRIAHSVAFHGDLPVGSVMLADAPSAVSDELAHL